MEKPVETVYNYMHILVIFLFVSALRVMEKKDNYFFCHFSCIFRLIHWTGGCVECF